MAFRAGLKAWGARETWRGLSKQLRKLGMDDLTKTVVSTLKIEQLSRAAAACCSMHCDASASNTILVRPNPCWWLHAGLPHVRVSLLPVVDSGILSHLPAVSCPVSRASQCPLDTSALQTSDRGITLGILTCRPEHHRSRVRAVLSLRHSLSGTA